MTGSSTRPRRRAAAAVLAGGALVALLAGCAAGASSDSGASEGSAPMPADVQRDAAGEGVTAPSTDSKAAYDASSTPLAATIDRKVVVRADMTVRVDDLAPANDGVLAAAARHDAIISSQTTSAGGGMPVEPAYDANGAMICPSTGCPTSYASSVTTLRVDNAEVDALIRDLAALGTVEASYRTSDDVTAEVADVDARIASAEASLARVRALMGKATSIGDIVALEAELSRRQADLEALQARQRTLADQSALATVTVRLVDQGAPVVVEEESTGFVAGLKAGWEAFTAAAVAGLTVLGALVPFLAVLVPIGLLVWWLVRRSARTAPPQQPAPTEAA